MGKGGWDGEERWIKKYFVPHSSKTILELLLFKGYYIIYVFFLLLIYFSLDHLKKVIKKSIKISVKTSQR